MGSAQIASTLGYLKVTRKRQSCHKVDQGSATFL